MSSTELLTSSSPQSVPPSASAPQEVPSFQLFRPEYSVTLDVSAAHAASPISQQIWSGLLSECAPGLATSHSFSCDCSGPCYHQLLPGPWKELCNSSSCFCTCPLSHCHPSPTITFPSQHLESGWVRLGNSSAQTLQWLPPHSESKMTSSQGPVRPREICPSHPIHSGTSTPFSSACFVPATLASW